MCFVKDYDTLLAQFSRDILGYFGIKQIMERENDNIEIRQLLGKLSSSYFGLCETDHSSYCKIWTDTFLLPILLDVVQSMYTSRYKITCLVIIQFLISAQPKFQPTSWKLHKGILPGSALPFSQANAEVKSRHRESTILPFFSLLTYLISSAFHIGGDTYFWM